jgi:threonine/homoserine/homoserine lactone efflux protein
MMSQAFPWGAFFVFAFTNSFTPGPNVIMFASSGSAFGFKRTLPHVLGVSFGFPVMLLLVQLGLGQVFESQPWLFTLLTAASLGYITWLALKILQMGFGAGPQFSSRSRPMTFLEGAAFQWINGKAWQMGLMTATLYVASTNFERAGTALIFWVSVLISGFAWVEMGKRMTNFLQRPAVRRAYYSVLSVALILSTWPRGVEMLLSR